jgi:hypothetical protein
MSQKAVLFARVTAGCCTGSNRIKSPVLYQLSCSLVVSRMLPTTLVGTTYRAATKEIGLTERGTQSAAVELAKPGPGELFWADGREH